MKKFTLLLSLCTIAIFVQAKTVYVSPNGNDISGDGSKQNPYKTICRADTMVTANNDTVMLAPGTYAAAVTSRLKPYSQVICGESAMNTVIDFTGLNTGLFVDQYEITLTLRNLTLQNGGNTTEEGGGAVWMHALTSLVMENVIVSDNYANRIGGAICFYGKKLDVNNCYFSNNKVYDTGNGKWAYGGVMFIQGFDNNVNVTITNSTFANNTSDVFGGALTFWKVSGLDADNVLIRNCVFYNNKALNTTHTWTGGAINMQSLSTAQINAKLINNTFYENFSGNGLTPTTLLAQGAKTYLTLVNNILTNSSSDGVTMFVLDGSAPYLAGKHNIVRSVNAEVTTTDFYTLMANNNYLDPTSAMVTGAKFENSLTDNSTADVYKVPFLQTLSGSTTIDAGIGIYAAPNLVSTTDIRGATTVGTKDIGAFEFGGIFSALRNNFEMNDITVNVKNSAISIDSRTNQMLTVNLYSLTGSLIKKSVSTDNNITINVSNSGTYLLSIESNGNVFTKKIVVL